MSKAVGTFDGRCLPGVVCAFVGSAVCALWFGWDYGLVFFIGAALGSVRFAQ